MATYFGYDLGIRREGVFYSLFVLFQKIGVGVGISATSYILQGAGYISGSQEGTQQPESVIVALKIMAGPIPAALLVLSLIFAFFYPLDRAQVEEIRNRLDERKALLASPKVAPPTRRSGGPTSSGSDVTL